MAIGFPVDTGTLGPFTLEPDVVVTWGYAVFSTVMTEGGGQEVITEFEAGRWFRMAPSLAPPSPGVNQPGTSISIADANAASAGRYGEAVIIGGDGNAFPALTLINTSQLTGGAGNLATAFFNWLSAVI